MGKALLVYERLHYYRQTRPAGTSGTTIRTVFGVSKVLMLRGQMLIRIWSTSGNDLSDCIQSNRLNWRKSSEAAQMQQFYLLLRRLGDGFSPIQAFCAVGAGVPNATPVERRFVNVKQLEIALEEAGVNTLQAWRQLQVIHSGFPTFITLSEEQALRLGLLEQPK